MIEKLITFSIYQKCQPIFMSKFFRYIIKKLTKYENYREKEWKKAERKDKNRYVKLNFKKRAKYDFLIKFKCFFWEGNYII